MIKADTNGSRHFTTRVCLALALACGFASTAATPEELVSVQYEAEEAAIANPERGLYLQFTARKQDESLNKDELVALRDRNITLILRLYYLNDFREKPIASAWLDLVEKDLGVAREAGVKCILRFAYNESIGDPDASIDVLLAHMEQLRPILHENADVIAVAQAGYVGSWGEWHASTNDLRKPENAQRIIAMWLKTLPASRYVQVRTPAIKQMIVETESPITRTQAWTKDVRARVAHHNDCFLASKDDYGTYQDIDKEKRYLEQETRFLPMGGETCAVSEYTSLDNARKEFERFHWSYLNLSYHPQVIGDWREAGLLDEIENRLGYRLVLRQASVSTNANAGGTLNVALGIENVGWASPYNPRGVELLLRSAEDGRLWRVALDADPRQWMPGKKVSIKPSLTLPRDMPAGEYGLLLWLPAPEVALRHRPEYAIRLASQGMWEADHGWHDLGLSIDVGVSSDASHAADADGQFELFVASP